MKLKIILSALFFWVVMGSAQAHHQPEHHENAASILKMVLTNSERFAGQHGHQYFAAYQNQQTPAITLLGCSDSRAHATSFVDDPMNQIFSVRNIGNQMQNSFGSVDYGVYHLHTPILLVMGHTHCGAVQAALHNYSNESFAIVREVDHLAIPMRGITIDQEKIKRDPTVFEAIWAEGVERNVDYQVAIAVRRYQDEIDAGRLTVVGAVYDFMGAYGSGEGRLIVVSLNGEKDPEKVRNLPLLKDIPSELKQTAIKRILKP